MLVIVIWTWNAIFMEKKFLVTVFLIPKKHCQIHTILFSIFTGDRMFFLKVKFASKLFFTILQTLKCNEFKFFHSKKNVSFSQYLNFCVFDESTNFKICDVVININCTLEILEVTLEITCFDPY